MVSAVGYGLVWGEMKKCDNGFKKIVLDEKPMTRMRFWAYFWKDYHKKTQYFEIIVQLVKKIFIT